MAWEESVWPIRSWSRFGRSTQDTLKRRGLSPPRQNVLGVKIAPAHQSQGSK